MAGSSADAFPVPATRTPKLRCFRSRSTGGMIEYSAQGLVPFNCRPGMLLKGESAWSSIAGLLYKRAGVAAHILRAQEAAHFDQFALKSTSIILPRTEDSPGDPELR